MAKTNDYYIGFRVEMNGKTIKNSKFFKKYNSNHKNIKLYDLKDRAKVTIQKIGVMITASSEKCDFDTGTINFGVLIKVGTRKRDIERLVKIINVLGNDRLIRERVATFVGGESMLNNIPELNELKDIFVEIDDAMPGFVRTAWYYAPEYVIFKDNQVKCQII